MICPANQIFERRGGNESLPYTSDGSTECPSVSEFSDNALGAVLPDVVFQAAEPGLTQVVVCRDSSTGVVCPRVEGSKLGDNSLAFSTCCQNRSELMGGCLRINSNKVLRSVVMSVTIHRDELAGKLICLPLGGGGGRRPRCLMMDFEFWMLDGGGGGGGRLEAAVGRFESGSRRPKAGDSVRR